MSEYTYNPVQLVQPNQNVLLNNSIRCNKGSCTTEKNPGS